MTILGMGIVLIGISAGGCEAMVYTAEDCTVEIDVDKKTDGQMIWEAVFIGDCTFECSGVSAFSCTLGTECVIQSDPEKGTMTLGECDAEYCSFWDKPNCIAKK